MTNLKYVRRKSTEDTENACPCFNNYCLMGTKNSYTDWHIDLGGTSVWYHIVDGGKLFILVKPTEANLKRYIKWEMLAAQTAADQHQKKRYGFIEYCQLINQPIPPEDIARLELTAGDTMLLPAGWIHCVITTADSIVFGGNSLHSYCVEKQLRIRQLEVKMNMPKRFTISGYDKLHWYALQQLDMELEEHQNDYQPTPFNRRKMEAAELIAEYLQDKTKNYEDIPPTISKPSGLLKKVKKSIQIAKQKKGTKRSHP